MAGTNTPKPWDRRENETSKAYEAFCVYRDMGTDRSLGKVAAKLQKSETLMGRWSGCNDWVERAAQWDDEQDRIARITAQKEQAKAIKEMRKRHADLGNAILIKSAQALARIPVDEIKPSDIPRMVDVAAKLERIARGDVGEVVEERHGEDAPPAVVFYMPDNGRDNAEEEE